MITSPVHLIGGHCAPEMTPSDCYDTDKVSKCRDLALITILLVLYVKSTECNPI